MATPAAPQQSTQLAQWNEWISSPRPRMVRLKKGHRFWFALLVATFAVIPCLILAFLFIEWRTSPAKHFVYPDIWRAMPFVVMPVVFLTLTFWISKRDKQLMTVGGMAIGKVTGVHLGRRGPRITYEFLDGNGRLITASSPDNTRALSVGMVIPVFYNPENPETDQVALCGTFYEIAEMQGPMSA